MTGNFYDILYQRNLNMLAQLSMLVIREIYWLHFKTLGRERLILVYFGISVNWELTKYPQNLTAFIICIYLQLVLNQIQNIFIYLVDFKTELQL